MTASLLRYTYISNAQVDMLIEQIPASHFRRLAKSLEISISLASISLKRSPTIENRYSRLRIVLSYFEKNGLAKPLGEYPPAAWIIDQLPISSALVGEDAVLYFGVKGTARICIVGSRQSLIGTTPAVELPAKGTSLILEHLLGQRWAVPFDSTEDGTAPRQRDALTLELVEQLLGDIRGVPRIMQFCAYPVAWKTRGHKSAILATPLHLGEPIS